MTTDAAAAFTAAPPAPPAPAAGAGAPPPAPGAPPPPAPPAPPAAPGATNWYDGMPNADVKTWVTAKGFKDPNAVAESAYNLEKLIGFEKAGRTLVVPKDDAPPEEVKAFRAKLGVPETADGYKLDALKDSPPEFVKTAQAWMHKAGIPPGQANELAKEFVAFSATQQSAMQEDLTKTSNTAFAETTAKWGKNSDANLELGRRFANAVLPAEVTLDNGTKMQRADFLKTLFDRTGATAVVLEMFAKAGAGLGEHTMRADNTPGTPQTGPGQVARLNADPDFMKKYLGGDRDAMKRMDDAINAAARGQ